MNKNISIIVKEKQKTSRLLDNYNLKEGDQRELEFVLDGTREHIGPEGRAKPQCCAWYPF